jgi:hypothetical protein
MCGGWVGGLRVIALLIDQHHSSHSGYTSIIILSRYRFFEVQ